MITPRQLDAFGFSGDNILWSEIRELLDASIEESVEAAISPEVEGERRVHSAGSADGLKRFKDLLDMVRDEAKSARSPGV